MMPTVSVSSGWETVVEGSAREKLEREVLPEFLRAQRWFGGKGRRLETVRFADWGSLRAPENHVFAVLLEVRFADGQSDLYFLPLGVSAGEKAAQMRQSRQAWLIARLTGPDGEALLHDALADDDTCLSLMSAIGAKRDFTLRQGRICAFPTTAFASLAGDDAPSMSVERGPATSSNSLIIYGRRLMMKLFRRLAPGINPEFEIGRFLTEGRLFQRIPCVAGAIEYQMNVADSRSESERTRGASAPHAEPITLAILQSFIANQGDGWQHTVDQIGHYYEQVSRSDATVPDRRPLLELAESTPPPVAVQAIGDYLSAAATLGRRTAEMHRALSADPNCPAFVPEPFTPRDAEAVCSGIRARCEAALASLRENLAQLPPDVATSARLLLARMKDEGRRMNRKCLDSSFILHPSSFKIRCHGDYHLGQVLRVADDYVIIDFEGEPMRTVAERRAKQSPLKDVAGMLRSYHTAAYAGLFAFTGKHPDEFDRLRPWAELWFQWVSAAFLRDYRAGVRSETFVPSDAAAFAELLDAFMLEKNYYELQYELNNRPDWVRIPLRGILAMLEKAPSYPS